MDKKKSEYYDESDIKPRKWLMVILIIIALVIAIILVNKVITDYENNKDNRKSIFDTFRENIRNNDIDINKSSFNGSYEIYSGTKMDTSVKIVLDNVITNNKTNDRKITVVYKDYDTSDPDVIKDIKNSLSSNISYEVSLDYSSDGYVNKITIERSRDKTGAKYFNTSFEMRSGTQMGISVGYLLDSVITNNKTNEDIIKVSYNDIITSDALEITDIKRKLDDWTKYEVSLDYDEYGYVSQINIR